jgi:hypothetical protein
MEAEPEAGESSGSDDEVDKEDLDDISDGEKAEILAIGKKMIRRKDRVSGPHHRTALRVLTLPRSIPNPADRFFVFLFRAVTGDWFIWLRLLFPADDYD